jgi:hypothetical protein
MATVERFCGYCGSRLTAEGGESNPRRRPEGWNTPVQMRGNRYGSLTVLDMVPGVTPRRWLCSCACGGSLVVLGDNLRRGLTKKCPACRYKKERATDAPANRT